MWNDLLERIGAIIEETIIARLARVVGLLFLYASIEPVLHWINKAVDWLFGGTGQ